jgi:hypothetical protein
LFKEIPGGTFEIVADRKCWIPPVGKVYNYFTGELEDSPVVTRSTKKTEQFWVREDYPKDWKKLRRAEKERQQLEPDYFDPKLEDFRQRQWHRRLFGMWFMNHGKPTYITGTHAFYMNWWTFGVQFPDYRDPDRETFYFWEHCWFDPNCGGITEVAGRRDGKTMRAACAMYEKVSRTSAANGGIQSKNGRDAGKVFEKMISAFVKLPDFFKPEYDTSSGHRPKRELLFFEASKRGKRAKEEYEGEELESRIDHRASETMAYDGERELVLVKDEEGKTIECDVWERHLVSRYCHEVSGEFVGKTWSTTTVEEMEAGGASFLKLWQASDQNDLDENGRTKSWLYRIFRPAYKSMFFDRYGIPDTERAKQFLLNERRGLAGDPRSLSAIIRKKPFTPEEAFRIDGSKCLYDAMKLNNQLDRTTWNTTMVRRGNFVWEGGVKDTKVVWQEQENGKFYLCWNFPKEDQTNNVTRRGSTCSPKNGLRFVMGVDPYDHDTVEGGTRSNGAGAMLKRYDPTLPDDDMFNRAFVCLYSERPDTAKVFYEDMLKMAVYFGSPVLCEDNKVGMLKYFEERGYGDFLIWFDDREKPGVSASKNTHQTIAEVTEDYINDNCDKVWYTRLLNQWLNFSLDKTTKFDDAMAAGYALMADTYVAGKVVSDEVYDPAEFFIFQ